MTKQEFIAKLEAAIAEYAKLGNRNRAVENHLAKVTPMTEEQFAVHRAAVQARTAQFAPDVARMAKEIFAKHSK